MKVIIEDYPYRGEEAKEVLRQLGFQYESDGAKTLDLVGYHYSHELGDTVFFLPKVVINESGLVFSQYEPERLVELTRAKDEGYISSDDFGFIYGLSVWIYRAISEFRQQKMADDKESRIILSRSVPTEGLAGEYVNNTYLDIMLSLIRFNNENQDWFTFIVKNIHSGLNKINWAKTINHGRAIVQDNTPIYTDLVNRRKQINYEEELFIIFFSILQHLHDKYGFPVSIRIGYELLSDDMMEAYLDGMGTLRLEQIRYKYFSDKELLLWQLCYDFFAMRSDIQAQDKQDDYLLVRNFNLVFEAMIDHLLCDEHDKIVGQLNLKEQDDGKRVDHIYAYEGLIYNEVKNETGQIYYIGDSKYYKIGNEPGKESVYKQYTYARNVIQANLNLFNDDKGTPGEDYLIYRDKATEGYNITPNFFISADLPTTPEGDVLFDYGDRGLRFVKDYAPNIHFHNRLFDRDTLLLQHYNVNFLYILATYGSGDDVEQATFRKDAREMFRDSIIQRLQHEYQFFSLQMKDDVNVPPPADEDDRSDDMERLVDGKYFRKLLGKAFRPYDNEEFLYLSLDGAARYRKENFQLLSDLSNDFVIHKYTLGKDPREELKEFNTNILRARAIADGTLSDVPHSRFSEFRNDIFVVGAYRTDKEHLEWIRTNYAYNVRMNLDRNGYVTLDMITMSAQFLVLYSMDNPAGEPTVYRSTINSTKAENEMRYLGYPSPNGSYLLYHLEDLQYKFERVDMQKLLDHADKPWDGSPLYYTGEEIEGFVKE